MTAKYKIMKYINNIIGASLLAGLLLLSFQSCIDKFEEINTDPTRLPEEIFSIDFKNVGSNFELAQQSIYLYSPAWRTQLQQNLMGDVYSGYMMAPTPFSSNTNNMTYSLVSGWNGASWSIAYSNVMGPLLASDIAGGEDFQEFKAWAKIIRVEAMHRVSDIYGPIVYSDFGKDGEVLYDSQEEAYNNFFTDLESAIAYLTPLIDDEAKPFTSFDNVYGGDYTKWIKFANSLRLRLAIRVSKVSPTLAKTQGEAALSHSVGLIESDEDNFVVVSNSGANHPLNIINQDWNDIRMGAPMESILKGYEDPRIGSFFETSEDYPGEYRGFRQGIAIGAKDEYDGFSALTDFGSVQLMSAAEVHFLKAEAAFRGWAGAGDAKTNYEKGIETSFEQHGAGDATAYINDNTSTAEEYIDPLNTTNSISGKGLSDITIQWDNAATDEEKLERIITQKWIAMYPDGQEAWSEFRRTGYPTLFPVIVNLSGGTISTTDFIKRINFPVNEVTTNPAGYASGLTALGGADNGGTSLWWDVD